MKPSSSRPVRRSDTAERILDLAEKLIQTRGYSAFSYQDIADAIGIRKASIHYHYASKTDLGVAALDRYSARFEAALSRLIEDRAIGALEILDRYVEPYFALSEAADRVCLCGALAAEFPALPAEMQARVERFFEDHQRWLAQIITRGQKEGAFDAGLAPRDAAEGVFAALQGALLVGRATGDPGRLRRVLTVLKRQLARP